MGGCAVSHALAADRARRFAGGLGVPMGGAFAVLAAMTLMVGVGGLGVHGSPGGNEGGRTAAELPGGAGPSDTTSPAAVAAPLTTGPATPAPSGTARPAAGWALMPLGTDCLGCHPAGGIVPTAPPLAHPLSGWQNCTACHARDGLVRTAPGHAGIHAEECLTCHTKATAAGPPEPHPAFQGIGCLQCHGTRAPLPTSMLDRTETTCWLCHPPSTAPVPGLPHPLISGQTCRSCHSAGTVGPLPADHAKRPDATCTLCHEVSPSTAPSAPHDLKSRAGLCATCHGPGTGSPAPTGGSSPEPGSRD